MNKSVLALTVAASLGIASAQADTTLYGSARVSINWNKLKIGNEQQALYGIDNDPYWEVYDDVSRIGVQGSEDLGGGWSAIYQYEFGVDVPGDSKRGNNYFYNNLPRLVGLKSDWGAVTLGTQYTPYYNLIGFTDMFNSIASFDYFQWDLDRAGGIPLADGGLPIFYHKGLALTRRGKSVVYATPEWQGLSAQGMLVLDGHPSGTNTTDNRSPDGIDVWEANVTYKNGPWFAGAAFIQDRGQYYAAEASEISAEGRQPRHTDSQYAALVGWDNKKFGLAVHWQQYNPDEKFRPYTTDPNSTDLLDNLVNGRRKLNTYTAQGTYYFTEKDILRATYSRGLFDGANRAQVRNVEVGLEHSMSARTRLWVEYLRGKQIVGSVRVADYPVALDLQDTKTNVLSIGIRHDF